MSENINQVENQIITIHEQYVKNLRFERELQINTEIQNQNINTQPQIDTTINLSVLEQKDDKYEVTINSSITATLNEKPLFNIDLEYSALFTIQNFSAEQREKILLIHCPTIIFPFARRVIADITRDAAFPPLMINIIDFSQLYNQRKKEDQDLNLKAGELLN